MAADTTLTQYWLYLSITRNI